MGDRTSVQFFFYSCPPQQSWAIAEVIDRFGLDDDLTGSYGYGPNREITFAGPGPFELGYLEPDEQYLGNDVSCGSADEIRSFLQQHAPDARWDVWEDPRYDWLGQRVIHDPDLGTWSEECDANGQPCYPPNSVEKWLEQALDATDANRAEVRDRIERERGKPWLDMASRKHDKKIIPIGQDPADL